ncbi:hypothetical protein [Streptomyces syringium]|uniref:hypothetical protein n=1 Tax=Streptomyces syringium TaxID=76729 RepID=UPI0033D4A3B4
MFGSRKRRIEDLDALAALLLQQRDEARVDRLAMADALTRMCAQLAEQRQWYGRRLDRALQGCARYRQELAEQRKTLDRLSTQLMGAMGYDADQCARLGIPIVTRSRREPGLEKEVSS